MEQIHLLIDLIQMNDKERNIIIESKLPAFTKLVYNKRDARTDNKFYKTINNPPVGPIEKYCYCSYCKNKSPFFHKKDCEYPETKSLYLTVEGILNYIINKPDYSGSYNNLKNKWIKSELTQDIID